MPNIRTADEGRRREFPRSPAPQELAALLVPYDTAVSPPLGDVGRPAEGPGSAASQTHALRALRPRLPRLPAWVPVGLSVAALALGLWLLFRPGAGDVKEPAGSSSWTLEAVVDPTKVILSVHGPSGEPWVQQVEMVVSTGEVTYSLPLAVVDGEGERVIYVSPKTSNDDASSGLRQPILRPGERFQVFLAGASNVLERQVPRDAFMNREAPSPATREVPTGSASRATTPTPTKVAEVTPTDGAEPEATSTPVTTPEATRENADG